MATTKPKAAEVADALTKELAERSYPARRSWRPVLSLEEHLNELVVSVVVIAAEYDLATRAENEETYTIDVVLQKKVDPNNVEEIDALLGQAEDLEQLYAEDGPLRDKTLAGADWSGLDRTTYLNREHLAEYNLATATLRLTYILTR